MMIAKLNILLCNITYLKERKDKGKLIKWIC